MPSRPSHRRIDRAETQAPSNGTQEVDEAANSYPCEWLMPCPACEDDDAAHAKEDSLPDHDARYTYGGEMENEIVGEV